MIHTAQQYSQVTRGPGVVVVRCTAEWCSPCRNISKPYSELSIDNTRFYTVDVNKVDDFADVAHATKLPCFFIFKDGKPHGKVQGADLSNLVTEIKKIN